MMKASKYNIFFEHSKKNVGFNSYTQEFILVEPLLLDLYRVGERNKDFSELIEIHREFYDFLVDQGFLVDDDLDEFEQVKELSKIIDNDSSQFQLILNPTMNCNFKCWYCYETHIKDSKMDEKTISATINLVKNVVATQQGLKRFSLSFFGGEPLLYFDKVISKILNASSEICSTSNILFSAGMTTNGLLIDQEMIDICKESRLNHFQITLDGCKEQHDKVRFISEGRGSFDRIVENIKLIVRNGLRVSVRINCSVETLTGLGSIIDVFRDLDADARNFINFDIHKVWQVEEDLEPQLNGFRESFREGGFAAAAGISDTVVNSCYGDKRYQATLNYNGEVFKCTARDFVNGSGEGVLKEDGTISWNQKYEKRLQSKFNNAPCKECSILPICGGGCSQQALEHEGRNYCVHNFDEESKLQTVINKFKQISYQLV